MDQPAAHSDSWDEWEVYGPHRMSEEQGFARARARAYSRFTEAEVVGVNRVAGGWWAVLDFDSVQATLVLPPCDLRVGDTIRLYVGRGGRLVGVDVGEVALWHLTEEEVASCDPPPAPEPARVDRDACDVHDVVVEEGER